MVIDSDQESEQNGESQSKEETKIIPKQKPFETKKESNQQQIQNQEKKKILDDLSNRKIIQRHKSISEMSELFEPDNSSMGDIAQIKEIIQQDKILRQEKKKKKEEKIRQKELEQEEKLLKKSNIKEKSTKNVSHHSENKQLSKKEIILQEFCRRWWYALPAWPPKNYDYSQELLKLNLRKINYDQFRAASTKDQQGLQKVYEIEGYEGCFKDQDGTFIDLRPKETCPSYKNFSNKSQPELQELLKTALIKQHEQLLKNDQGFMNEREKLNKEELAKLVKKYT